MSRFNKLLYPRDDAQLIFKILHGRFSIFFFLCGGNHRSAAAFMLQGTMAQGFPPLPCQSINFVSALLSYLYGSYRIETIENAFCTVRHRPEQNRVTWKTPSSEAFVPLQEPVGVLASYVPHMQMQV
jgi:hypothetical protein